MKKFIKIIICILIILGMQVYILPNFTYSFSPSSNKIYNGIDVSGWQGNIDYNQVKNSGIDIVYMKASEGKTYRDPYFDQNYVNAKRAGLKVGFYHYVDARSKEDAILEARFFLSVISNKVPDCKLAMDFESFGSLSISQINEIALTFIQTLQELSKKEVVIYSDTSNASSVFRGELTKYPLWVAQYEVSEPTPNGNWNTWVGWQYESNGRVNGITGNVDRDKFTDGILLDNVNQEPISDDINNQDKENTTTIIIKWGDTLNKIALEYNTTVRRLVELNNIENPNLIYAGNILIVPTKEVEDTDKESISGQTIYIVQKGDTLNKIATMFDTTAIAIANQNNIININLIYIGQKLIIPTKQEELNNITYKIQWGDTLYSISRRYGVSIATIVRLNRIKNPNLIYAGATLKI